MADLNNIFFKPDVEEKMTYLCICERYTHDTISLRPPAGPVLVTLHPGPLLQPEVSRYTLPSTL